MHLIILSFGLFVLTGCIHIGESLEIKTGPAYADNVCPVFKKSYPKCEIMFGNKGLSVLNSFYETFVGEGAFEIYRFDVKTISKSEFIITAQSNRGELISEINADRIVRIGQDKEDERLNLTNQASYCHDGMVTELQEVFIDDSVEIQHLQYWTTDSKFYFQLFQGGNQVAKVICK